jgi:purine-nucleoside phosphorylase
MEGAGERSDAVSYEQLVQARDYIAGQTAVRPEIGVICGSGLGGLAEQLDPEPAPCIMNYHNIPHFPEVSVAGHTGNLVFGCFSGRPAVCMQGRFHCYEGYSVYQVTMPVRVMHLLGVKTLVVTNASGGLNPNFRVGDIMVIRDHINLAGMAGVNPLIGPNDTRFGPRFPPLTTAYDKHLRQLTVETALPMPVATTGRSVCPPHWPQLRDTGRGSLPAPGWGRHSGDEHGT